MILEKVRSEGIAHNSYFLGSKNEAAVVDPRRDCDIYLCFMQKHHMKITHIFETHRHEDFVSGSEELARRTGATIVHGAHLDFDFGVATNEGDAFTIGDLTLEVLDTPGHTNESISLVVMDQSVSKKPLITFTGDCLFAGDIGRTDLAGKKKHASMASMLYKSIFEKLLPLGDQVLVCPAHGKGSICGGEISDHEFTTLGYERQTNPMLLLEKDQFVDFALRQQQYVPPYFHMMEEYNLTGPPLLPVLPVVPPLRVAEVKQLLNDSAQLLDIRSPTSFFAGHIPGSINIWRSGLPQFAGWFLSYEQPFVFIDDFNTDLSEVVRYLVRLGFDNLKGYLVDGFSGWSREGEKIEQVDVWSVPDFFAHHTDSSLFILDVREKKKWEQEGYILGAHHLFVGELPSRINEVPQEKNVVVYCDSGFKTSIAASILKQHKYPLVTAVLGGISAWKKAGYPIETCR